MIIPLSYKSIGLVITSFLVLVCFSAFRIDGSQDIIGIWKTAGNEPSKIEIFQKGNQFYGKIIWLAKPLKENGQPKTDTHNPDKKLKNRPIIGLELLQGFQYNSSDNTWEDGTIYDPESGNTYSCIIRRENDKLKVRGYIGLSLFGRTEVWSKVN